MKYNMKGTRAQVIAKGEAAFAAAWEAGKRMDFETAVSLVKTALQTA
jgi:hypothetical protein